LSRIEIALVKLPWQNRASGAQMHKIRLTVPAGDKSHTLGVTWWFFREFLSDLYETTTVLGADCSSQSRISEPIVLDKVDLPGRDAAHYRVRKKFPPALGIIVEIVHYDLFPDNGC
jgi:hypothetical protein